MVMYDVPNMTGGGDELLYGIATTIPLFTPMFLMFIWFFVVITGSSAQSNRVGYIDFPLWTMMGSMITTMMSLILTLKVGMIDGTTLAIVVSITLLNSLWYFMSRGRN